MKRILLYISCLLLLVACHDSVEDSTHFDKGEASNVQPDIVVQARSPRLTNQLFNPKAPTTPSPRLENQLKSHPFKYLGYTYKFGNTIVGHTDNTVIQLIDIIKLYNDPVTKENVDIVPIIDTDAEVHAYADYNRFEKNTSMTKKVESGFNLNLGLFKFGRKKTVTDVFKTKTINLSHEVTGEVNLLYLHSRVKLDNTSGIQKKIAAEYVTPNFRYQIYNTPIAELTNKWGALVLSHYYTGGRAHALYVAEYKESLDFESKERDMEKHLNASFAWKSKTPTQGTDSASANFGLTYKNGYDITKENKITNVHNYIKLSGGSTEIPLIAKAGTVTENSIDLSAWAKSLSDVTTHAMIGVADEGLVGLDKFVLEENFKRRIRDSHMERLPEIDYQEPFVEVCKVFVRQSSTGEQLSYIAPVINTRHGDKIIFCTGNEASASDAELKANNNLSTFNTKAAAIAEKMKKYFECDIKITSTIIKTMFRSPLSMEFKFNPETVYKYTHPANGMTYIYDAKSRTAISYRAEDEFIPWLYGTIDWFDSKITEKKIPMSSLYQLFTIVGL